MSKHVTEQTNFRERSASYATHGSRRGVNLLGWDKVADEHLSCSQERDALVARVKQLHEDFRERGKAMSPAERRRKVEEFNALNARINAIRPKMAGLTKGSNVGSFMLDVLRERLPKTEWRLAYEEALRRCDAFNRGQQEKAA